MYPPLADLIHKYSAEHTLRWFDSPHHSIGEQTQLALPPTTFSDRVTKTALVWKNIDINILNKNNNEKVPTW